MYTHRSGVHEILKVSYFRGLYVRSYTNYCPRKRVSADSYQPALLLSILNYIRIVARHKTRGFICRNWVQRVLQCDT